MPIWLHFIRWGTFVLAVATLIGDKGEAGPLVVGAWIGTACALGCLLSGREALNSFLGELGLKDPLQTLVVFAVGFLFGISAFIGYSKALLYLQLNAGLMYEARMLLTIFGGISCIPGGAILVFSPKENLPLS